jgi:hypothetical protein
MLNPMFDAVLFESQTPSSEEDICFTGRGKIRYSIADKYNQWDFIGLAFSLGFFARLVHARALVVA